MGKEGEKKRGESRIFPPGYEKAPSTQKGRREEEGGGTFGTFFSPLWKEEGRRDLCQRS